MTNPGPRFPADPSAEVRTQAPRRPELDPIRYTAKTGSGSRTVSSLPYTSRNGPDGKGVRIGASGPQKQSPGTLATSGSLLARDMMAVGKDRKSTNDPKLGYWRAPRKGTGKTEWVNAHCRHVPVKAAAPATGNQPAATGNAQGGGTAVVHTGNRGRGGGGRGRGRGTAPTRIQPARRR